jgi:hypothetical protein
MLSVVPVLALCDAPWNPSTVRFLPTPQDTQVADLSALANGDFRLDTTIGRVRLSPELTLLAVNGADETYSVASAAAGIDTVEILDSPRLLGFTGISANFAAASFAPGCSVRRFAADESLLWYQHVTNARCTAVSVADNGDIWLSAESNLFALANEQTGNFLTLRADGTLIQKQTLPSNSRSAIANLVTARGANLGGAFIVLTEPAPQLTSVAFVDAAGVERWRVPVTGSAPSLRALASGGVEIAAQTLQTFNASGQRVSERQNDAITGTLVSSHWDASTGERFVLTRATECALTKRSSAGVTQWRTVLPCAVTADRIDIGPPVFNAAHSDSALLLTSADTLAVVGKNAIALLNSAGTLLHTQSISGVGVSGAALNPTGTRLLYIAITNGANSATLSTLRQLSVASKLDSVVALPPNLRTREPQLAQQSAPDGTIFAITRADSRAVLIAISSSGQALWQQALTFDIGDNLLIDNNLANASSDRMVCVTRAVRFDVDVGESRLACWNARSGQALFELVKPAGYFPTDPLAMRIYGDRLLIARPSVSRSNTFLNGQTGVNYEAISDAGAQLFALNVPGGVTDYLWGARGLITSNAPAASISTQEALQYFFTHGSYVGFRDADTLLSLWDTRGALISSISYPYALSALNGAVALSTGLLVARREGMDLVSGTLVYEFFDDIGRRLWRQPASLFDTGFLDAGFEQEIYPLIPASSHVELKQDLRDAQPMLYALRSYDVGDASFAPKRSVLQKIDLSTGALLWRRSIQLDPSVAFGKGLQALELPTQKHNGQWQVLVHGQNVSGENLVESMDAERGTSLDVQLTGDQFPANAATVGNLSYVMRRAAPLPRRALPLGAPGQLGAWYNPATPGQGFFIERIANTQFMAWFHSEWDLPGANTDFLSPARQRWLSLQGDVLPGATQSELKIYQSIGGSFTVGSTAAPMEVGNATLTFLSCDSATLRYELSAQRCFGPNCAQAQSTGMLHGVIPLRALLPATGCATISALPAPIDAKTGLFHDPNVAGQGLITVASSDTLFAGWFTRDPAGAADNANLLVSSFAKAKQGQAWFTLQTTGPVSANAAVVRAKIYRTLGGRRDSPLAVTRQEVGDATLSFSGCAGLTMRYQFSDGKIAAPFQNLRGELNLTRLGQCRQ